MIPEEKDIYRDSLLRYLGYSNEIGEAFRPLVHHRIVNASYGIAVSYALADVTDKTIKNYKKYNDINKAAITAGDVFLWQILASVLIPGFTINRITWLTARLVRHQDINKKIRKVIPTLAGLCSIPVIISPIDKLVDLLMDETYRKFL